MITESTIYWILKLDNIIDLCVGLLIPLALISVIGLPIYIVTDEADKAIKTGVRTLLRITIPVSIVLAFAITFLPTTKQMATIKVIPAITNSEAVTVMSNDAKEIYNLGIKAIKDRLKGK